MGTGIKIPKAKQPPTRRISEDNKKVLIIHDNRIKEYTEKAHKIGEMIDKIDGYEAVIDKDHWNPGEKTSDTETNNREKEMVKKSDIAYRFIPPTSITKEERHDGSIREVRKVIKASKPLVEHYYQDAKDSPNRSLSEKNYKKRETIRTKKGEHIQSKIKETLDKVSKENNKNAD
ncbi:MAG: hypothetical protein JXA99_08915 [Candidatus Lokiarchaeota archaeon]|nr:hypothetical protein [Candidatus Lokiarchaeota archaeon]